MTSPLTHRLPLLSERWLRRWLVALLVCQLAWLWIQFRPLAPAVGGDTADYVSVAVRLASGDFSVIRTSSRPPAYPLVLWLAQAARRKA